MTNYEIITYGGGEVLQYIFNGIAAAVGNNSYSTMIRLTGFCGLAWVLLESTFKNSFVLNARWLVSFLLLYNIMLVPKVTIQITDRVEQNAFYTVANVPWGLAIFASLSSQIGDGVTQLAEENFSLPDDLKYGKSGTVMASSLIESASNYTITNPDFVKNMQGYMQQCVFYDVLLEKYSFQDLLTTNDLWGFVSSYASPARSFLYENGKNSQIFTCKEGTAQLTNDWQAELKQASIIYGSRFFPKSKQPEQQLLQYLPVSYQYLTQLSDSASHIMQQTMMSNLLQQSVIGQGATTNAAAAVEAYAVSRAQAMKRSTYQITGELAAHWLPLMKNVFEALFYGAFLFLFLLMLLPIGGTILRSYIMTFFWLQSWPPLYAVLNLVMTVDAKSHSLGAITQAQGSALSFMTQSGLAQVNSDTVALAGYLSMSIPLIAYHIVRSGAGAFSQLAGSISSVGQTSATSAAGEATTGNISLGNSQLNNHSAYNTSANHFNTNATVESGMVSYQTESGAMIHHTSGGTDVIDNRSTALSNIGTHISLADSIRASASTHYEHAISNANNETQAYGKAMSTAIRGICDLSLTQGHSASSDNVSSISESASYSSSISHVKESVERFAHQHGLSISQASQVLGSAYASLRVGIPEGLGNFVSGGGQVSIQGLSSAQNQELFSQAKDFVRHDRFSENVDTAIRSSHDQHYRTGSEQSERLVNSISQSSDEANTYRTEAMHSLQQADSYREMASLATEKAQSINTNNTQAFVNWVKEQPPPGSTTGHMGIVQANKLLHDEPETAHYYATQYAEQHSGELMKTWMQEKHDVLLQKNSSDMTSVHQDEASQTNGVDFSSKVPASLSKNEQPDKTIEQKSQTLLNNAHEQINSEKHHLNENEKEQENKMANANESAKHLNMISIKNAVESALNVETLDSEKIDK